MESSDQGHVHPLLCIWLCYQCINMRGGLAAVRGENVAARYRVVNLLPKSGRRFLGREGRMRRALALKAHVMLAALAALAAPGTVAGARSAEPRVDSHAARPRVVVMTDIANEPDDQMSMVRLLLYS